MSSTLYRNGVVHSPADPFAEAVLVADGVVTWIGAEDTAAGLAANADAVVDRSTWRPQPIFDLIQAKGRIEDTEMEATFNMGVGMFAIVSADDADRAMAYLTGRGVEAWQVGEVIEGTGQVQMIGQHTRG